jgi:hypothetical protein
MATPWPMEDRIAAAVAWLITGESEEAGRLCNIPGRTIRTWMQQPWWEDVVEQAKGIKQKELDALWTGLIHTAANKLKDSITHGDIVFDKLGGKHRQPVKAKDLAVITSILVEKRALSRGQVTSRTEKISSEQKMEQLRKVKKTLEEMDSEDKTLQ